MLLKSKGNENTVTALSVQFVKPEEKANQINMAKMNQWTKADTVLYSPLPIQNYNFLKNVNNSASQKNFLY